MSDRGCRVYVDSFARSMIQEMHSHLAGYGIRLEYPGKQVVATLLSDGSERFVTRQEFDEAVKVSSSISFLYWRAPSEDVYCRIRKLDNGGIVDFGMFGMTSTEVEEFIPCILSFGKKLARESRLRGLMVDRTGDCAEGGWDEFFLGDAPLPSPLPRAMAVRLPEPRVTGVEPSYGRHDIVNGVMFLLDYEDNAPQWVPMDTDGKDGARRDGRGGTARRDSHPIS